MKNLKFLRKARNKTLKDIALTLDTSPQVISRYELGQSEPDFATLIKLADYFGVSVDYLLGHDTKDRNSIVEFADGLIVDDFFKKNTALLNEENFIDLAKLFNAMTQEYKTRVLTYVMGVAEGLGLNVDLILS